MKSGGQIRGFLESAKVLLPLLFFGFGGCVRTDMKHTDSHTTQEPYACRWTAERITIDGRLTEHAW